jgi:HSP20 family molecular chaperone IbpA
MLEDPKDMFRDMDELFAHLFARMTSDFPAGDPQAFGYHMVIQRGGESSPVSCSQPGQLRAGSKSVVEVHRIGDEVKVITELPGITRESLHLTIDGNKLSLDADAGTRQYHTTATLPPVDPDSMQVSLKNGVLEVTFGILATTSEDEGR